MKHHKIHIEDIHRKSQGKIAIEWGIQELDCAETLDELKEIWSRFPALHETWQFQLKAKMMKRKLLYAANNG